MERDDCREARRFARRLLWPWWVLLGACTEPEAPRFAAIHLEADEAPRPWLHAELQAADPAVPALAAAPPGGAARLELPAPQALEMRASPLTRALLGTELARACHGLELRWARSSDRGAIELVVAGKAEAALVATEPSLTERGLGASSQCLGWLAVGLVVGHDHPVTSLTDEQVRAVIDGTTTTWSDLTSRPGPIVLVSGPSGPIAERIVQMLAPGVPLPGWLQSEPSSQQALARAASDPAVLAVVPWPEAARAPGVRLLAVHAVVPDEASIRYGRYPYATPVHLVWRGQPSGPVRELVQTLASPAGQAIVRRWLVAPAARS